MGFGNVSDSIKEIELTYAGLKDLGSQSHVYVRLGLWTSS
jgi:hypothetical protein